MQDELEDVRRYDKLTGLTYLLEYTKENQKKFIGTEQELIYNSIVMLMERVTTNSLTLIISLDSIVKKFQNELNLREIRNNQLN